MLPKTTHKIYRNVLILQKKNEIFIQYRLSDSLQPDDNLPERIEAVSMFFVISYILIGVCYDVNLDQVIPAPNYYKRYQFSVITFSPLPLLNVSVLFEGN